MTSVVESLDVSLALGRIDVLDGAVRDPEVERWSVSCYSMTSRVCQLCRDSSMMAISIRDATAALNQVFLSLGSDFG